MKIVVLTTDTLHHAYFVRELSGRFPLAGVLLQTEGLEPPFEIAHPFEAERDALERDRWFAGESASVRDYAEPASYPSLNSPEAIGHLKSLAPDLVFVFGTKRLRPPLLEVCPEGFLNLHGGDPEEYRGLDSHLWAIYHRDFPGLVTTLHRMEPRLDTGDVVLQRPIPIPKGAPLASLRLHNTELCVRLCADAVTQREAEGKLASRPQEKLGRYYSFMPSALKALCVDRFARWTARL